MYNKNFMELIVNKALEEADEIPVCAAIVKDNKIITVQINQKEKLKDVTAHAEILAIREASKVLNNWRLDDCDLYVTLEPCPMCAAAIISARIKNLYFGSYDYSYGGFSTGLYLKKLLNSQLNIEGGKMEAECDKILKEYFKKLRDSENEKTVG